MNLLFTSSPFPATSSCPTHQGHFVRSLGAAGDKETETEVLLLEHDVPHQDFSQAVLSFLPKMPWSITPEVSTWQTYSSLLVEVMWVFLASIEIVNIDYCVFLYLYNVSLKQRWVDLQDMAVREDLRALTVCSVDPPGCTDIDDALHCKTLENGNFEVTQTHLQKKKYI